MKMNDARDTRESQDNAYTPVDFKRILIGALVLALILVVVKFYF